MELLEKWGKKVYSTQVSVCMATYNGEKYLSEQISSILIQLKQNDELIVVDDCSTDNTLAKIEEFKDSRIKVYCNTENIGVILSFEKAIKEASGSYIFLSDQDDIWLENKVEVMVKKFESTEFLTLISDAYIMYEDKNIGLKTFYDIRTSGAGFVKNYIKNSFIGCCMAFRAELKSKILPFPAKIPMHDQWIGLVSEIHGGTLFLPDRLQIYRRHEKNFTQLKTNDLFGALSKRKNIIISFWSFYFGLRK